MNEPNEILHGTSSAMYRARLDVAATLPVPLSGDTLELIGFNIESARARGVISAEQAAAAQALVDANRRSAASRAISSSVQARHLLDGLAARRRELGLGL